MGKAKEAEIDNEVQLELLDEGISFFRLLAKKGRNDELRAAASQRVLAMKAERDALTGEEAA